MIQRYSGTSLLAVSDFRLTIFSVLGWLLGNLPLWLLFKGQGSKVRISPDIGHQSVAYTFSYAVLPSIVNAVLITSAFSAANTFIFSASRILYGLAVQNKAPKIFTTCTSNGLPWIAVIAAVCIISVVVLFDWSFWIVALFVFGVHECGCVISNSFQVWITFPTEVLWLTVGVQLVC